MGIYWVLPGCTIRRGLRTIFPISKVGMFKPSFSNKDSAKPSSGSTPAFYDLLVKNGKQKHPKTIHGKICSSKWIHLPRFFAVKIPNIFELPPPSYHANLSRFKRWSNSTSTAGWSSLLLFAAFSLQGKRHVFHLPCQSAAHFVASNVSWPRKHLPEGLES